MTWDYDALDGYGEEPQIHQSAAPVQPSYNSPKPQGIRQMDERKRRIALANLYQKVLEEPFFENPDEVTLTVESEIRSFVQGRFDELLGMGSPTPVQSPVDEELLDFVRTLSEIFDDEALDIIKGFVETVKKRQSQSQPHTVAQPTIQRKTKPESIKEETQPKIKRRTAPVPAPPPPPPKVEEVREPSVRKRRGGAKQSTSAPQPEKVNRTTGKVFVQEINGKKVQVEVVEELGGGERILKKNNRFFHEKPLANGEVAEFEITKQTVPSANETGPKPIPPLSRTAQAAVESSLANTQIQSGKMNVDRKGNF